MSMIRLELSNRDYNTIAEALLESALDWEHAADELGVCTSFAPGQGDPAYGAKLARLDREQYRHRRLARRRRAVLERLPKTEGGRIMLMELDYETVSALESALIVAEDSKMRDAKDWANIAESLGASEQRRAADNLAAFCGGQADRYRKAMDALQRGKKRPQSLRTQRPGPNMKTPVL